MKNVKVICLNGVCEVLCLDFVDDLVGEFVGDGFLSV